MSQDELQGLVDGVAAELDAAVWLGDHENRLLAHTAHDDVVDEVRRSAIIHRRLTADERSWFEQWGIDEATVPMKTPADENLGILERWCVPVRFRGTRLGYMWIIGRNPIAEAEIDPAVDVASQIAVLLYRRHILTRVNADLLRLLLVPSPENDSAAEEVRALGGYTHEAPVAVIVVGEGGGGEPGSGAPSDLALATQRAAAQATPGTVLAATIANVGVLLAPLRDASDLGSAKRLAEKVRMIAAHLNPELDVVAAIGGVSELERASRSYAEARRAFRMLAAMPDLGPVVTWDDLGVFRALALLPRHDLESGVLDARVKELISDSLLATTAETFLDLAGNVQESAAALYLHRTTLYNRLDRIASLYKLDLRQNGDHRLITHLGFKLARLANPTSTR